MNTTIKFLARASVIVAIFCANSTFAAKLDVKNETGEELKLVIEPGKGSVPDDKNAIKKIIKVGESRDITVEKNNIFTDSFSITGKRGEHPIKDAASVIAHTCQGLDLNKDYIVKFTKNSVGQVECNAMSK